MDTNEHESRGIDVSIATSPLAFISGQPSGFTCEQTYDCTYVAQQSWVPLIYANRESPMADSIAWCAAEVRQLDLSVLQ